ncbi:MAG: hypothetical protein WC102_03230 [Saccharofermentanales bacterium]
MDISFITESISGIIIIPSSFLCGEQYFLCEDSFGKPAMFVSEQMYKSLVEIAA